MISIAKANGSFIKTFPVTGERTFGFHRLFGLVSEEACDSRLRNRKAHGLSTRRGEWLFRFKVTPTGSGLTVAPVDGCTAVAAAAGTWTLKSALGEFTLGPSAESAVEVYADAQAPAKSNRWFLLFALLFFIVSAVIWVLSPAKTLEEPAPIPEPVTVNVVKPTNSVRIPAPAITSPHPELANKSKDDGGKRAVAQNLGFLGLLGKKELNKAVGGVPSGLQNVSPGAGLEGDKGSGGEMLVGLGQGVKRTTVGNTGVAGLGGVGGGKGPGGGAGGYGDTLAGSGTGAGVGQGNGRSLTSLPLSQDIELEGGLDKAVIAATIAKYLSQVRACYEQGLRRNRAMAGQVTMAFEIGGNGKLNFAKPAKSSLGDAEVPECIATRMMGWDFPKPIGGVNVKVSYPFLLRPVNN